MLEGADSGSKEEGETDPRAGKKFTSKGKREVKEANTAGNDGEMKCEGRGKTRFWDSIGNMTSRTESGATNTYNYPSSGAGSSRPHAVANVSGSVNGVSSPID